MGAVRIRQSNDGPLLTQTRFTPDDLCCPGRLCLQLTRAAIGDICVFVPVFLDIDSRGANTADPATTDSIIAQRVKQNEKLARVIIGRRYAFECDLILEFAKLDRRIDDGVGEAQYFELTEVFSGLIPNLDNVSLAKGNVTVRFLVVLMLGVGACRIDHRVPGGRWNLERSAGLGFGKLVSTHDGASSSPRSEKLP